MAMEIYWRKTEMFNLKFSDVDALIKPGNAKMMVKIPEDDLGIRILEVIGKTQRDLKDLRVMPMYTNNVYGKKRSATDLVFAFLNNCGPALKTLVRFDFELKKPVEQVMPEKASKLFVDILRPCVNLEYLKMDYEDEDFAYMALNMLRKLKVFDIPSNLWAVLRYSTKLWNTPYADIPLSLTHLSYDSNREYEHEHTPFMYSLIHKAMPNLESVKINSRNGVDISALTQMSPNLKVLEIRQVEAINVYSMDPVIRHHGSSLRELTLCGIGQVCFFTIVEQCPNLQNFSISKVTHVTSPGVFTSSIVPLRRLITLVLEFDTFDNSLPEKLWWLLLCQALNLERLVLANIDDECLKSTLEKVYNIHDFPKLLWFFLHNCIRLPFESLLPMIEYSKNPLTTVCFGILSESQQYQVHLYRGRVKKYDIQLRNMM